MPGVAMRALSYVRHLQTKQSETAGLYRALFSGVSESRVVLQFTV